MDDQRRPNHKNGLFSESDELLALALEATSDGLWDWDVPSGKTYFSPRYFTMLGYEPDELPASYETWTSLLHPDDRQDTIREVQQYITNNSDMWYTVFTNF